MNSELETAKKILSEGGVVGVPTETVYGLAGLVDRSGAIRRIFELKERPFFDPLIVHVGSYEQWERVTRRIPTKARALAQAFWPGPLTIICERNLSLDPMITAGLDGVGVRMPKHPIARAIAVELDTPFAAPSANKFGKTSPTTASHVREEFLRNDLFVVDGGPCEVGIESTVVDCSDESVVRVVRPGSVTKRDLEDVVGPGTPVVFGSAPSAPGQGKEHYQPAIPLYIVEKDEVISGSVELFLPTSPILAARMLYSEMRRLAGSGASAIVVKRDPSQTNESWNAIWNRLERAASTLP